jgi:GT2 family glycosyltransferase
VQLTIIIVNYNVKYFVELCLQSVFAAIKNCTVQIIVVDNASTDGSKEYLAAYQNHVQFIWLPKNIGFAKANNLAAQKATGTHLLFLNPDTIIAEDTLDICLQFYKTTANVGCVGVRMVDGRGQYLPESKRAYPTLWNSFCKATGLYRIAPNTAALANYYHGNLTPNKNHQIQVVAGAFLMVPTKLFLKIGGFDERYFMYAEDIDLSFAVQQQGYYNYYLATTTIIHFKGESAQRGNLAFTKKFYGAMVLFAKKHYQGIMGKLLVVFLKFAIILKAMASFILFKLLPKPKIKMPIHLFTNGILINYPSQIQIVNGISNAQAVLLPTQSVNYKNFILQINGNEKSIAFIAKQDNTLLIYQHKNAQTVQLQITDFS